MSEREKPKGPIDPLQVPRFAGPSTFARLPRLDEVEHCDVAIVGVPFDSGVTFRPGARFGPIAVRQASRLLRGYHPSLDVHPFAAQQVADAGDIAWHARSLFRHVQCEQPVVKARPSSLGEGLQVLRYLPGAEYRPHHDYFDPAKSGTAAILERGGQRVGSLVMYLNTPEKGGGTIFPDVALEVAPIQGNAVFFSYDRPHPVTRTLHGGAPVIAGEKWVATKWLRQGRFE